MSGSLLAGVIVALLPFARKRGVDRIVTTHPEFLIDATPDELREMSRQGAYLEHEAGFWVADPPVGRPLAELLAMIREYGPEHTVLSSDLGQQGRSHPAAGLERVANAQLETGVREADLERMLKQDPATLLGLS